MAELSGRPHTRDDAVAPRVGGSSLHDHLTTFLDRAVIRPHTAAAGVDLGARAIPVDGALLLGAAAGLNDALEATAAWAQGVDALCRCVRESPVGPARYAAWCLLDAAARAVSRPEFRAALQRQLPTLVATHMPLHPMAALGAAGGRGGLDTAAAGGGFGAEDGGDATTGGVAAVPPAVARMLRRLEFDVFLRLYLDLTRSWSVHRPGQPALAADAAFAAELSDAILVALSRLAGGARHGAVARVVAASDAATGGATTSAATASLSEYSGPGKAGSSSGAVKSEFSVKSEPGTSTDAAAKQRAVIDRIMRTIGAASRQHDAAVSGLGPAGAATSSSAAASAMTTVGGGPIPFTLDARRQQVARFVDACASSRRATQCCPRCGTFLPTEAARVAHMEQQHPVVPDLSAGPVAPTMLRLPGPTPAEFVRYRGVAAGTPEAAAAPMLVSDAAWQAGNRKGAVGRGGNPIWRRFG